MSSNEEINIELVPFNRAFSSSIRLTIMLILFFYKKVRFVELQGILKCTPGNLDYHLKKLESENYVIIKKIFYLTRPTTLIRITNNGENSIKSYAYKMKDIFNKVH
ncbi:MAG: transcriptional regulator [Candidatus Hodarchaeota archaeon]